MAIVGDKLVGEVQTCAIQTKTTYGNLICYIIGRVGTLINLAQSKAFNRVNHQYLAVVFKAVVFGPIFCCWIADL